MKTYWDYTEKERSELTEEGVKELLKFELMMKGVEPAKHPVLRPIHPLNIEQVTVFEVDDIYFETLEAAQKFIELKPCKSDYEYGTSYERPFRFPKPIKNSIVCTTLASHKSILLFRDLIRENEINRKANESLEKEYEISQQKVNEAEEGVWDNWHSCKDKGRRYEKICKTLDDYKEMTEGNQPLALEFLNKIYLMGDIEAAKEWCYGKPIF